MNLKHELLVLNFILLLGFFYFMNLAVTTQADMGLISINYLFICFLLNFGFVRFKELLNPITFLVPFCLAYLYYGFMLSDRQVALCPEVLISYYSFVSFFFFGTFCPVALARKRATCISKSKIIFVDLVFISGGAIFLFEAILNGGFPLMTVLIQRVGSYSDLRFIPVLHYLVMLSAIMPSVYYYCYRSGYVSKKHYYLAAMCAVFIILNTLSRQLFILGLLTYLIVFMKINNIRSVKTVCKWALSAGFLFLLIGQLRILSQKDSVSPLEFLKAYSGVPRDLEVNTFDVTFNLYSSLNFVTLNDLYTKAEKLHFGIYTLKPILVLFHYDKAFAFEYLPDLDGLVRLGTILSDPYLDFGILGVVIFAFSYGALLSGAFLAHAKTDNLGHSLIWASLCYAMVMSVFANYFNVMFIWICIVFALCFCYSFSFGSKTALKVN